MSINANATTMNPSVHFLDFTEASNPMNHPDHFHVLWQLHSDNQPPRRRNEASSSTESSNDAARAWKGIFEGDLVVFSTLLSGAGEFEAVRFVGRKTIEYTGEDGKEEVMPLLTAGIEYPEFPTVIVHMAEERGVSLRELYEVPFNAILQSQPGRFGLIDLFSSDEEAYREFWDDVPVARRRRPPSGTPWTFSLRDCVWTKTLTFAVGGDSHEGGEEL